jgi:hypothetical protein
MAENKEIIEKLIELVEIYLENAQMNEVSTEWQEGDIDFEEVLSIVVHDGLYDLNFTEEQTDEFLALYKALNQKQVEISEAKLDKETKKGDNIMEKQVKPVTEKMGVEVYSYVGKDKLSTLDQVMVLKDLLDVMWNAVYLYGEGIDGRAVLFRDLDGGYELDLDKHEFGQDILKMKVKTDDSYDNEEGDDELPIIYAELTDEPLTEGKKTKITKKPLKESVRLIYNPREKTEVKEKIQLSFDGEPLPVDIKESNTHTKLRLFKIK